MKRKIGDTTIDIDDDRLSSTSLLKDDGVVKWFKTNNIIMNNSLSLCHSNDCNSLGVFVIKDIAKDELLIEIPLQSIFSLHNVSTDTALILRNAASSKKEFKNIVTAELLIYIEMIHQNTNINSQWYSYFQSLDKLGPSPLLWKNYLPAIRDTNLYDSINDIDEKIKEYANFLNYSREWNKKENNNNNNKFLNENDYNYNSLLWARSHYVSRRYPDILNSTNNNIDEREINLGNLGNLIPCLDLINHDSSETWLRLEVKSDKLHVINNVHRLSGTELYSNYGLLGNEELLYAFGFSILNNVHDKFTLKLKRNDYNDNDNIFYITKEEGIPLKLWIALNIMVNGGDDDDDDDENLIKIDTIEDVINIDTAEVLLDFLEQKLLLLNTNKEVEEILSLDDAKSNFIKNYRVGQHDILTTSIECLLNILEMEGDDGDNDDNFEEDIKNN